MKNIFNKIPKKLLVLFLTVAVAIGLGTAAVANFGPDRPTREWTSAENGFDYVTFNSFTGVPNGIGDERDFLRATINGSNQTWTDPVGDVVNNDRVTAKIYIHNNADPLLNDAPGRPGVARDVNVRIEVPEGVQTEHEVMSYISASNAQPKTIFDGLDVTSLNDSLFELDFVPGSARLGGLNGTVLSDDIFTTGVNIGDMNGCFEYVQEITFELEVKKPGYLLQKTGRIKGEGKDDWRKVVNAERGDVIEWRIYFENTGSTVLDDVSIIDDLPTYTTLTPGSVELVNANNPGGFFYGPEAIQRGGDRVNIIIDDYNPGGQAFIFMESTIDDHEDIQCGNYQIANVAYAIPNYGDLRLDTINSNTKVNIINEECETPDPVYSCDLLTVAKVSEDTYRFTVDATARDGATIDSYRIDPGDGSDTIVSNSNVAEHTYVNGGTYTVEASVVISVNGETQTVTSEDCKKHVTIDEEDPFYSCDMLTVELVKDNTYKFTVDASAGNGAEITEYGYEFGDGSDILITEENMVEHTYDAPGTYLAMAAVVVSVNGNQDAVGSEACIAEITIDEEEKDPVYTCDDLKVSLVKDNTFKFTTETTARNGATVKDYSYDFGDDTEVLLTDKNMVEHTYAGPGEYKAEVTVRFNVNDEVKTAGSENCKVTITISDNEEPEVEGESTEKPTTLPSTGAGSLAGAFAAITAAGAAGHSLITRRRK